MALKRYNPQNENKNQSGNRAIDFRQLGDRQVIINPDVLASGMTPVFYVGPNMKTILGFSDEVPKNLIPIQDYNLLQQARSFFTAPEQAAKKGSLLELIKKKLVMFNVLNNYEPKKFSDRLKDDLIMLNQRLTTLEENLKLIDQNPDDSEFRNFLLIQGMDIAKVIDEYIMYVLEMKGDAVKTLTSMIQEKRIFDWVYRRLTSSVDKDLGIKSIERIFFPKKIDKGFTYKLDEADFSFPETCQDEMNVVLRKIAQQIAMGTKKDSSGERLLRQNVLVIPPNLNVSLEDFSNAPKMVGNEFTRVADLSANLICSLLGINPGRVEPAIHLSEFSDAVFGIKFKYETALTDKPRVQFLSNLRNEGGMKNPYAFSKAKFSSYYLKMYQIRSKEEENFFESLSQGKLKDFLELKNLDLLKLLVTFKKTVVSTTRQKLDLARSFNFPGKVTDQDQMKFASEIKKPIYKVLETKRLEEKKKDWPSSSPLSSMAQSCIDQLKKSTLYSELAPEVENYLKRFHNRKFMDLAVKIIAASVKDNSVDLPDTKKTSEEESTSDEEIDFQFT